MGILNVTPDSFSDGGRYTSLDTALKQCERLVAEGAHVIDIGGESSRPGAAAVSVDEELERVVPIIEKIAKNIDCVISVDTTKSTVARAALDQGAHWLNDISAGRFDHSMKEVAAEYQCPIILMHSREKPSTMQENPRYDDPVTEVLEELRARVNIFTHAGVLEENIILDPGIGFAKRFSDNITLLAHLDRFVSTGFHTLLGVSRKSFLGEILNKEPQDRIFGSTASAVSAYYKGVKIFRVHDAGATSDVLKVITTIDGVNGKQ